MNKELKKRGQPIHGKEVKETYSGRMEPWLKQKILDEFPNLSLGIELIVMDWVSRNQNQKTCE